MVVAIVMNAMNSTLSPMNTHYEIAGVFVRILRIPGTLASWLFPVTAAGAVR
jgi:hypothetical protein